LPNLSFGGKGSFRGTSVGAAACARVFSTAGQLAAVAAAATDPKNRLRDRLLMGNPRKLSHIGSRLVSMFRMRNHGFKIPFLDLVAIEDRAPACRELP
jgi:hypothetical protein